MATAPAPTDTARLSFAKVAASGRKESLALASFSKVAASSPTQNPRQDEMSTPASVQVPNTSSATLDISSSKLPTDAHSSQDGVNVADCERPSRFHQEKRLIEAVKALKMAESRMPNLVVNGSGTKDVNSGTESELVSEEVSIRADSGSDLGTKPPSLDEKSVTSGTTFALDEKESLRPDDSASVKAAEDDDAFSAMGSIVAGSRIGSEAAARAYRIQIPSTSDRHIIQSVQGRHVQGVLTPQSISSDQQVTDDVKDTAAAGIPELPDGFNLFYRQTPDEKLLEALDSPKDRIFLLRLEQNVIGFVKDSKEPFIDLPPCNSFCRMLTHKLADYYHMTHQVDGIAGAVRIFRTPFCRLPPSLTSMSNPPTSGNSPPPPALPAMKIMRRGGEGDTNASPSKATSDAGSDAKERSMSAKEKMSREEREALYNRARERIFGKDDKSGDATPDTEDSNDLSRSSSVSTKDRSTQNRRGKTGKQRRDDSESFDVRSQYTPFFPQQPQSTWGSASHYGAISAEQLNGAVPGNFQPPMASQFGFNHLQYNQSMMSANMPPYQISPLPQPNQTGFTTQPVSASSYIAQSQGSISASQQWSSMTYQNQHQPRGNPSGQSLQLSSHTVPPAQFGPLAQVQHPSVVPYAFGQLPSTLNPADPKSQHPIPGSFNRHAFNPKTQSFIPGSSGPPQVAQAMQHNGSPHRGASHPSPPHLTYSTYSPPQQPFSNGMGYNMARQESNQSAPSYHASHHLGNRPLIPDMPQHPGLPQIIPHAVASHNLHQGMPSRVQPNSHLPTFGNPSNLPPKPPTGL